MKKFSTKEYQIFENIAQAKSILRKNGGSIEDEDFLKISDTTNKDGWTGLLTRLVYVDGIDVDEVIGLYDDLKKSKLNLGKLNKMSYDDIVDELYISANIENDGIYFVARTKEYLIFHVKTYEDGLNICSPSWCLKTRFHWDSYTRNGMQFVIIEEKYINKGGRTKLLYPNHRSYMGGYSNNKRPSVRFGISVKSNNNIKIFDDNNINRSVYDLPEGVMDEILSYFNENNKIKTSTSYEFNYGKDIIIDFGELNGTSWDGSVHSYSRVDYEELFSEFMDVFAENNLDPKEFYNKFKNQILDDDDLMHCNGLVDYIIYRMGGGRNHDEGGIPLSGMFLNEREETDHSYKYVYGFSVNKYGRMYILQSYNNIAEWYEYILNNFSDVFLDYYMSYTSDESVENIDNLKYIHSLMNCNFLPTMGSFFDSNSKVNSDSVSINFHTEEYIEVIKLWFNIIVDYTSGNNNYGNIFDSLDSVDNLNQVMRSNLPNIVKSESIIQFIDKLENRCLLDFEENIDLDKINKLNDNDLYEFFNRLFKMNGQSRQNPTKIELLDNGNINISFHYNM